MGLYFNGKQLGQPFLNGKMMNGYFNGLKLWVDKPKNLPLLTEASDNILTEDDNLIITE